MRLALVMEMVVDKDVDVKDDEDVDVEVDCEVFEEVARYVYNALKRNSPHKDQWMRMLVFAKQRQPRSSCVPPSTYHHQMSIYCNRKSIN